MNRFLFLLFFFVLGCSDEKIPSLPNSDLDISVDLKQDFNPDLSSMDVPSDPDINPQKCNESVSESCLNLGFYGGELTCSDGVFNTADCLKCSAHQTESTGTLGDRWTKTGPPGGNITTLLALENNVVLAGTGRTSSQVGGPLGYSTGIYRSDDGGKTFTLRKDFSNANGNKVHNFARVGSTDRIYATISAFPGDLNNGVWMSDDAGLTWTDVSAGLHESARPRWVVVAPGEPERVYLTVEGEPENPRNAVHSLYRRDDGGDWTILDANGTEEKLALAIAIIDRDTVLLLSRSNVYKSVNAGENFVSFPFDLPNPTSSLYIPKLVVDSKNPDHLFRTTENVSLAESLDGGESWRDMGLGFGQTDIALIDDKILITTKSGGLQTWENERFTSVGNCLLTVDPSAISIAPDDAEKIYVGFNGQGVLHSADGAKTFTPQTSGVDELLAKVVVTGPVDDPVAWIVSPAGLFRSIDSGAHWNRVADNQGTLAFNTVAQDPNNPNRILVGTNGDWYAGGGLSAGVFELDIEKETIHPISGFQGIAQAISGITFDPTDANVVYVYQDEGGRNDGGATLMFVSNDGGKTFKASNIQSDRFAGNASCSGNLLSISETGIPYFCSRPVGEERTVSIYTSKNKGTTFDVFWTGEARTAGNPQPYFPYSGMFVDKNEDVYFTGAGENGLAIRRNGESEFVDFGRGLGFFASQIWHMAFTPDGGILLATSDGVQYAENGMDFAPINEGFERAPRAPRGHSIAYIPKTNVVLVATANGVFRRTLP